MDHLAVFIPCEAHTLNLTVSHAAEASDITVRFFLFVQLVYVFFSRSPHRWEILVQHLKKDLLQRNIKNERLLVPKRLSDTRWSARADACRAIKSGYGSFITALNEISNNDEEEKITRIEAQSIRDDFFKLETGILVEFWSSILDQANKTSKSLQGSSTDIEKSISLHKSMIHFFERMRNDDSFNEFEQRGMKLISDNRSDLDNNPELTYNCYAKGTRKRNTRYEIGSGTDTIFDDRSAFRVNCFYTSLDSILTELRSSASIFEANMKPFIFLTTLESQTRTDRDHRKEAENLREIYCSDLDESLYDECVQFKFFMEDINDEIQKDKLKLKSIKKSNDEEGDGDDDDEVKLISKSSRMLKYIKKTNIEATFPNTR